MLECRVVSSSSSTGVVKKRSVLGVLVDVTNYAEATERIMGAARDHRHYAVTALAVHGVMTGVQDRAHNARLNSFDLVTPDGQPVRWALNLLHHASLAKRNRVIRPRIRRTQRRRRPGSDTRTGGSD